jgi:hypothetical protein
MVEVLRQAGPGLTAAGRLARLFGGHRKVAILAVCAAILALRREEALTNPQFWAEDAYFFERAYVLGWHSFLEAYAGYLHTVLRVIAEAAVCIDPSRGPAIFVACAGAATLYVAGRTMSARCPLPQFAGASAIAVVLVPDTYEVFLNVVNLQWVLAAGLVLLLISGEPVRPAQWVHDIAAAALIGLTGPFCVILAPLFAWRAWSRRTRASVALAAIIFACALVQVHFFVAEPQIVQGAPKEDRVAAELVLPAIARRIGGSVLLGAPLAAESGRYAGAAMGIATLAGVGYMAFRRGALRPERAMLGLAFAAMLAGALFRTRYSLGVYFAPLGNGRYVFVPQLIAIWLLLVTAAARGRAGKVAAALAILAALANIPRLRAPAYADLHWDLYAPYIRAGERVAVPVNPPGWMMPLPARKK